MRPAWHRAKARQLISAAGDVKEVAHMLGVCDRQAYRYQNYENPLTAPQIITLEAAAMEPIYSAGMASLVTVASPLNGGDPMAYAAGAAREAGALPALVHAAMADGRIDRNERRAILDTIAAARADLDAAERALCAPDQVRAAS